MVERYDWLDIRYALDDSEWEPPGIPREFVSAAIYDALAAENARLKAQVAAYEAEDQADRIDADEALREMERGEKPIPWDDIRADQIRAEAAQQEGNECALIADDGVKSDERDRIRADARERAILEISRWIDTIELHADEYMSPRDWAYRIRELTESDLSELSEEKIRAEAARQERELCIREMVYWVRLHLQARSPDEIASEMANFVRDIRKANPEGKNLATWEELKGILKHDTQEDSLLPTLASLAGCAPDATGDLSSDEFVRQQRDEWDEAGPEEE